LCAGPEAHKIDNVSPAAGQLVGRDEELGAIVRILDTREQLPGVIALSGEAGVGKTTLWSAGIDWAAAHGYRVLSARPSEAETRFSFAGLTDLIGACADDVLAGLPPVQRRGARGPHYCSRSSRLPRTIVPSPPPSSARCGCSPATILYASRSTTSNGSTRRLSRPFASPSPGSIASRSRR
jgi:hypothetical protein